MSEQPNMSTTWERPDDDLDEPIEPDPSRGTVDPPPDFFWEDDEE